MAEDQSGDESANERSYRHLREGIIRGRLPGGTMLSEAAVAAELGVSRTPVRAALARLQDEGWVTIYPKRGALVQTLGDRAVSDLAQSKAMLESGAVRLARRQDLERLAGQLRTELAPQKHALESGDLPAFVELSITFHRAFAAAANNGVLLELYDRLADRQRFLLFSYGQELLGRSSEIIDEHLAMLDAIAGDDADAFARTLQRHLANTYGDPHAERQDGESG